MTTRDIVFVAVGAVTALSALLSVTTKHVVHAALWLLVSLGSLAGAYLVLGQELVGLVQLLVYVGAIVVLVLFALMLTRAPIGRNARIDTPRWQRVVGGLLGAATTVLLGALLLPLFSGATADLDTPTTTTTQSPRRSSARGPGPSSCSRCCCSWRSSARSPCRGSSCTVRTRPPRRPTGRRPTGTAPASTGGAEP